MKKYLKQLYFILIVFCATGVIQGLFSLVSFFQMSFHNIYVTGMGTMIDHDIRIRYLVKTIIAIVSAITCIVIMAMLHFDRIRNYKHSHLISIIVSSSTIFVSLINMFLINNIGWIENFSANIDAKDYYEYVVYQIQESAIYSTFVPILAISCAILAGAIYFFKKEKAASDTENNKKPRKKLTEKQIIIIISAIAACVLVIVFVILLACGVFDTSKNFEYTEENGQIVITGYTGEKNKVVIPEKIGGKYVSTIGKAAFGDAKHVKEVILPDSVTIIEASAFSGSSLTKIDLGDSVVSIGDFAFKYSNITEIELSDELLYIGKCAFERTPLKEVILPSGLQEIGEYAFSDTKLEEIYIPSSVETIGSSAFYDTPLKSVIFGNNSKLTVLEKEVFKYCGELTSITLPSGLLVIKEGALANTGLTSISLPNQLTEIEAEAFANTEFTSITIPASVVKFYSSAFKRTSFDSVELTEIIFESPTGWKRGGSTTSNEIFDFSNASKNVETFDVNPSYRFYVREEN